MMFTYADMERAYAEHGDALVWMPEPGQQFSANPADYWSSRPGDTFRGVLAVRVPATLHVLTSSC